MRLLTKTLENLTDLNGCVNICAGALLLDKK